MKAILSLTATLISVLCLAQDYISIPYSTSITAKVPVQYSFYNGTATVKKTADVELVIENFRAHHSPINSFADGGLAGGFKCDIVFNTWFSYSEVAGLTIDNEFVPFDKLGIKELNFTVNDVRF